jgi:hypothetical protein
LLKGPPGGPPKARVSDEVEMIKPRTRAGRRRVSFIELFAMFIWRLLWVSKGILRIKSPGG